MHISDWQRAFERGWKVRDSLLGVVVAAGKSMLSFEPEKNRTYEIYVHRKDDIRRSRPWSVYFQECMVDVHFSRSALGGGDPYETLLTAESEANPNETIEGGTSKSPLL